MFKKYTFIIIYTLVALFTHAQTPEDAVRYSFYTPGGTARAIAIGGAMGSLGGDITSAFVNPAGLGFYKTTDYIITLNFIFNNNKATFRDVKNSNNKNNVALGTTGAVWGFSNRYNSKNSHAFSLAFNKTANFNNQIKYSGLNNYSSYAEQFAEEFSKSGKSIDYVLANNLYPSTSAPALYTYLIDTVTIGGVVKVKAAPEFILDAGQAIKQVMDKNTKGGIYELALAYAYNNNDKWYIGGTIGIPIINYNSTTTFSEFDTSSNTSNHFNAFEHVENLKTTGMGLNVKLGIIYKPTERIRLGLAIHTPTYMALTDKYSTTFSTKLENPIGNFYTSSNRFTNDVPIESKYTQNAPLKIIASASYVFKEIENVKKQKGFITADIEYVNHKGSKFGSDNQTPTDEELTYYKALNQVIKDTYKGNFNFRIGGELKFNTIMTRLGFAYYSNPYKNTEFKTNNMVLSGGLGYRNKGFFIDVTYAHNIAKSIDIPYVLSNRANTYATLNQQRGNILATIGVKF